MKFIPFFLFLIASPLFAVLLADLEDSLLAFGGPDWQGVAVANSK